MVNHYALLKLRSKELYKCDYYYYYHHHYYLQLLSGTSVLVLSVELSLDTRDDERLASGVSAPPLTVSEPLTDHE